MPALTCTGQPVNRYARATGAPCGATWSGETLDVAAVAGWRIGPGGDNRPGLCPRCVNGPSNDDDSSTAPSDFPDQLSLPGLDVQQL